jgi:hypothetical protein
MIFDPAHTRDGEYVDVDFAGTRFRNVNFEGAKVMEAHLVNARFSGLIAGLVINDVEVAPLIEAELNRRFPERAMLTPTTAADVRTAWSIIECNWAATRSRIIDLPESVLHERLDGEWSCLETLRHRYVILSMRSATTSWTGRFSMPCTTC